MRLQRTGTAVLAATALSALVHAQDGNPVYIRNNDGQLMQAARVLNPADVPRTSALYGVTVIESAEGNSAIVSAATPGSLLRVGDRIDEVQLPGIANRERHGSNSGYWTYQVWTVSDFYRLAAALAGSNHGERDVVGTKQQAEIAQLSGELERTRKELDAIEGPARAKGASFESAA